VYKKLGMNGGQKALSLVSCMPASMNFKWKARFSEQEQETLLDIMSRWLKHYGYE
jgi:hypothetical protein